VKQIRDLNDGTRTRIKKNTPLYILDPSMSIVKLKLDRYVCYDNIDEELSTECYYYYPVTKEILSYLLITPVSGIYLYRDDSVEYLEFNDMTSLYLYKIIRSYFIEHNWRFIGF